MKNNMRNTYLYDAIVAGIEYHKPDSNIQVVYYKEKNKDINRKKLIKIKSFKFTNGNAIK